MNFLLITAAVLAVLVSALAGGTSSTWAVEAADMSAPATVTMTTDGSSWT